MLQVGFYLKQDCCGNVPFHTVAQFSRKPDAREYAEWQSTRSNRTWYIKQGAETVDTYYRGVGGSGNKVLYG